MSQANVDQSGMSASDRFAALEAEMEAMRAAYREANELLASFVEQSHDLVQSVAPDGTFLFVNRSWRENLGYSAEEVAGMHVLDVVDPEWHAVYQACFERILTGEDIVEQELVLRTKTGELLYVDWNATQRRDGDRIVASQSYLRNTTRRRVAEQALLAERNSLAQRVAEQTAELRAANEELMVALRLKDEFLANVSHDLRTPLQALSMTVELLEAQIYGPLSDRQSMAIERMQANLGYLGDLVNDVLDLAKLQSGKFQLHMGRVRLTEAVQASLRLVEPLANAKRQQLQLTEVRDDAEIEADPQRLQQILVNLLSNAVKFTPEGGRVGLEVANDDARRQIVLTVWDTGIGIPPSEVGRLFQPFVQLDNEVNRKQRGTGLGLALVSQLARLHNGDVAVESQPGAGSRFTVILPWQRTPQADTHHPDLPGQRSGLAPTGMAGPGQLPQSRLPNPSHTGLRRRGAAARHLPAGAIAQPIPAPYWTAVTERPAIQNIEWREEKATGRRALRCAAPALWRGSHRTNRRCGGRCR